MAQAHYLSDKNGDRFYPYAHASATYDKNGITVEERLDDLNKYSEKDIVTIISETNNIPTAAAVKKYVDESIVSLPEPMIFKGSLGVNGTISKLPVAAAENEGFTYKVITDGTYQGIPAKIGDTFISNGSKWELIPSGDEPSGTVTSVGLTLPTGLKMTGNPVTSSGNIEVGFEDNYSIPTIEKQNSWSGKQDALTENQKKAVNSGITSDKVLAYDNYATVIAEKGTYSKPISGIPVDDLSNSVKASLEKADSAIQSQRTYYCTCGSGASISNKAVTCSDLSFTMEPGVIIVVTFANSNVAADVTLNVNSKGAKAIRVNNAPYVGTSTSYCGYASRQITYMYDGVGWAFLAKSWDSNTWTANSANAAGYVASPAGAANKIWKTDANGNPGWRDLGSVITEDEKEFWNNKVDAEEGKGLSSEDFTSELKEKLDSINVVSAISADELDEILSVLRD